MAELPCGACKGARVVINRRGKLVPIRRGEPRKITSRLMRDFYVYNVRAGETCPCPKCGRRPWPWAEDGRST